MNNGRRYFAELLKHLTFFIMLASIAAPVVSWLVGNDAIIYIYVLIVPFFIMISIKQAFGSLVFFALPQLLIVAAAFFLPLELAPRIICFAFLLFSMIYAFTDRLSDKDMGLTLAFVALIAAINIAAGWVSAGGELNIPAEFMIGNVMAVIVCYILHAHMIDISESLDAISLTSIQPVTTIKKFNNAAIVLFIALAAVAALFSGYLPVAAALRGFGNFLLAAIRFLVSLGNREETPYAEDLGMPNDMQMSPDQFGMEPTEPFILWVILEAIFMFLVSAAIVVGIIAGIGYLFYKLYKRFYATGTRVMSDYIEFAAPEAKVSGLAARLADVIPFLNLAPVNKARRLFYKKVRGYIKKGLGVKASDTAREIAAEIGKSEDIGGLTAAYEEARYYEK